MKWQAVIGLEVHAQLASQSKIFSGATTNYGALPNTQACAIDLGLPGVLPMLNEVVVTMAIKFGLAIDANIAKRSVFARKNYFYPDLPKGYQISQYDEPIVQQGHLDIILEDGSNKRIGVTRAHLEEDAGKSLHEDFHGYTGIDLNRAGTPLLEIVSEPDLRTAKEAYAYLKTLHTLVRYLDICDGNMQEGSFRCDANVSVRPQGETKLGTRTEIKNLNSFRFIEKAIDYEIKRHIDILEQGGTIEQQTRLYNSDRDITLPMRSKEEAHDYRYFPDPDLLPVILDDDDISNVRATLPELPQQKQERFITDYQLSSDEALLLVNNPHLAHYFEQVVKLSQVPAKLAVNWITGELAAALNKHNLDIQKSPINSQSLANLLKRVHDQTISGKIAKQVFAAMWDGKGEADQIITSKGLQQITDTTAIKATIEQIIAENPNQLADYRAGKEKLFAFFVGQVMKATQGKANPQQVNQLLRELLKG